MSKSSCVNWKDLDITGLLSHCLNISKGISAKLVWLTRHNFIFHCNRFTIVIVVILNFNPLLYIEGFVSAHSELEVKYTNIFSAWIFKSLMTSFGKNQEIALMVTLDKLKYCICTFLLLYTVRCEITHRICCSSIIILYISMIYFKKKKFGFEIF